MRCKLYWLSLPRVDDGTTANIFDHTCVQGTRHITWWKTIERSSSRRRGRLTGLLAVKNMQGANRGEEGGEERATSICRVCDTGSELRLLQEGEKNRAKIIHEMGKKNNNNHETLPGYFGGPHDGNRNPLSSQKTIYTSILYTILGPHYYVRPPVK